MYVVTVVQFLYWIYGMPWGVKSPCPVRRLMRTMVDFLRKVPQRCPLLVLVDFWENYGNQRFWKLGVSTWYLWTWYFLVAWQNHFQKILCLQYSESLIRMYTYECFKKIL